MDFFKKPLYKYKPLERYRKGTDNCQEIGETSKYRILMLKDSGKYFLRQEKANPKKVVFLGDACYNYCVFHDKIFTINKWSNTYQTEHPLYCIDIENGEIQTYKLLSDKEYRILVGGGLHSYCQDAVETIKPVCDGIVMEITRHERNNGKDEEYTYYIRISHNGAKFVFHYEYPERVNNDMKVAWRDNTGKIACMGDSCETECDDSCPIWLNTMGLSLIKIQQFENAIERLKKALEIAPDFLDALNNLGTAYGMNGQHQEAYSAFLKVHEEKPYYSNALHGLIVAETKLGMNEQALQHCDEFDRLPNCNSKKLREAIQIDEAESKGKNYIGIAEELLVFGRENGFISSQGMPYVPELLIHSGKLCEKITMKIFEYGEKNSEANVIYLSLKWCAFAGIGAVHHWNINWPQLSEKGIYETLTEERGIYEMDEYVSDCVGKAFRSDLGNELSEHLTKVTLYAMNNLKQGEMEPYEKMQEVAKAMYLYGMVLQMNELGMY